MMMKKYDFQDEAVDWLFEKTLDPASKKTIVLNAPTGSGKTVILIKYIDKLLAVKRNIAVVWLCPGKGDLEEQSRNSFDYFLPSRQSFDLNDAMTSGFEAGSTSFINWDKVTKKDNKAITENEKDSLYDKIKISHNSGIEFIIIVDEEHSNNTAKANDLLRYFDAIHTVRVSATTVTSTDVEYKEVDEEAVIGEGLITEAISVNEGVVMNSAQDDAILLELADAKRKEIQKAYKDLGKRINPLVLIQFPNGEPDKIKTVEQKLDSMGYSRKNGMVAAWLSGDKADIPDNLVENDSDLAFLFIKQAINTGWNCKRAKILVKLRESSGNENFQIQTIGRIRRMPEGVHYNIPVLDMCYIYTYDKKYQTQLMRGLDKAYIPSRLFLKEQYKDFTLPKELKDEDGDTVDFATVYNQVRNAFVEEFNLTGDREFNKQKFTSKGFRFGEDLYDEIVAGVVTYAKEMLDMKASLDTVTPVSTTEHGFVLRHVINDFKTILGIPYETMRAIMDRLFCFKYKNRDKLLRLNMREYYAFIINNEHEIKDVLRKLIGSISGQGRIRHVKEAEFHLPVEELYPYDTAAKDVELYQHSPYEGYSSAFVTSNCRKSDPEIDFEKHCERSDDVEWFYKNGDKGIDYLSVVYQGTLGNSQSLFYPDYVVKLNDGTVWIIETKGGQKGKQDQNIDIKVLSKFYAFKDYAEKNKINWGFVRPMNGELYLNNTEYTKNIEDSRWVKLNNFF